MRPSLGLRMMSVSKMIETLLTEKLAPTLLVIEDESHKHRARNEAESHFKVLVVSPAFEGKSILDRHRQVNEIVMVRIDICWLFVALFLIFFQERRKSAMSCSGNQSNDSCAVCCKAFSFGGIQNAALRWRETFMNKIVYFSLFLSPFFFVGLSFRSPWLAEWSFSRQT